MVYFLLQLKSLEAKHDLLQEETRKVVFYLQILLLIFVITAFTSLIWHYFDTAGSDSLCNCTPSKEPFQPASEPISDLDQEL